MTSGSERRRPKSSVSLTAQARGATSGETRRPRVVPPQSLLGWGLPDSGRLSATASARLLVSAPRQCARGIRQPAAAPAVLAATGSKAGGAALLRGGLPKQARMLFSCSRGTGQLRSQPERFCFSAAPSPYTRTYVPHCGHGLPHDRPGFALRQQSLTPPPLGQPDEPAPCR